MSKGRIGASLSFVTVMVALASRGVAREPADAPVMAAVHQKMQGFVDAGQIAGAVTLVAKEGVIVHLDAVGWANKSAQRPMKSDAIFSIASMTKPVTAVAAMMLVEAGKLSLDEPIASKLPEFGSGRRQAITLKRLLSHTSGLAGNQQNIGDLASTSAAVAKRPLAFEPGAQWAYSPGLSIAGRLIEVASGQSYDAFLAERIFRPLGMKDTAFSLTPEQTVRLAQLHRKTQGGLEPTDNWFLGPPEQRAPNPSGGLFSTARDTFRFWQMLLNGGELDGVRILSKESVALMTRPITGEMRAGFVPGSAWALGVGVVASPTGVTAMLSSGSFGHGGVYGTQVWVDPQRKAIFLLLIQQVGIVNSDASPFRQGFQEAAAASLDGK